jgi:hypothetical protein
LTQDEFSGDKFRDFQTTSKALKDKEKPTAAQLLQSPDEIVLAADHFG